MRIVLAVLFGLFLSSSVFGAVVVTTPLIEKIDMQNGQLVKRKVEIKNLDAKPAQINVYLEDLNIAGQEKTHSRSNKRWLSLGSSKIILAAGETKSFTYEIQVPNGRFSGSYWSRIIVEPIKPVLEKTSGDSVKNGFGVKFYNLSRYAITVISSVGSAKSRYSFAAPRIEKNKKGIKVLSIGVANVGARHGYFKTQLDVFNTNGVKLVSLHGSKVVSLLPQAKKRVEVAVNNLNIGKYKGLLTVEDVVAGQTFGTDISLDIRP